MQSKLVPTAKIDNVLNPDDSLWQSATANNIELMPTPSPMQPTEYIRTKWESQQHGRVNKVSVKAISNDRFLAFHLSWHDPNKDNVIDDTDKFVDAAAIMVSTDISAPLITMGNDQQPVDIWQWKADAKQEQTGQVVAKGIGTTNKVKGGLVRSRAVWRDNYWHVVIARPLAVISNHPLADLGKADTIYFGLAIWEGSNQERGGIKSVTFSWQTLALKSI